MSELIEKLRNPPVMSMALDRDHLSRLRFEIMQDAADQIEALSARVAELEGALTKCVNVSDLPKEVERIAIQALTPPMEDKPCGIGG